MRVSGLSRLFPDYRRFGLIPHGKGAGTVEVSRVVRPPGFDLRQILSGLTGCGQLLKYNRAHVEIRVAVVQYQSVIPYLVETIFWRTFRLTY